MIILILQSLENLLSSIQTAVQSSTNPLEHEIRVYLAEPLLLQDFSPDTWWGSNLSRFPHLARFARQYLSAPATTVPSEATFSTAGDIISNRRSRLSSENAQMLIFLKENADTFCEI